MLAEYLRLGAWDLLKGFTGKRDYDFAPRIALQLVNEAAVCRTRIRAGNQITNQGFEILNGNRYLVSDEQVHKLLSEHTIEESLALQESLAKIRKLSGHYKAEVIAIDPHRIKSSTKRVMTKKRKKPGEPAKKLLQTFFALDADTGQPIVMYTGSSAINILKPTLNILKSTKLITDKTLFIADKEHYTDNLFKEFSNTSGYDILVPAIENSRIKKIERSLQYKELWAGYAASETEFGFINSKEKYRLIVQREGLREEDYKYKAFLTTSKKSAQELMVKQYPKRWTIESFFDFEGAMGFDKALNFNLNVRYGKMTMAMIAQAAVYQFRQKLPFEYRSWNALHLSNSIFTGIDGDIKVVDDTIVVTCYNAPKEYKLHKHYTDLPQRLERENIDPRIPWLYNFKLDFRFK